MLDILMQMGFTLILVILLLFFGFLSTALAYISGIKKARGEDHYKVVLNLETQISNQISKLKEKELLLTQKDTLLDEIAELERQHQERVHALRDYIDNQVNNQKAAIFEQAYNDAMAHESIQLKVREVEALEKIAASRKTHE